MRGRRLPSDDREAAAAATRLNDQFLAIIAAGLELSGHLDEARRKVSGEQLVRLLVD